MTDITRAEVEHVALLARLRLTEAEKEDYTRQLSSILSYAGRLGELDLSAVEPTAHAAQLFNVLREDVPGESMERDKALANAPAGADGFFRVPRIV
ncbi:MAG: Asp-tRNA(Asn)/Glu-tRNA(Gln) amidotransferase subunit GatC [Gracilibacteraceae bacterium]|jgi:aspartyl-tRNA(Asn)/glutamyl-tRNA(Gln) amidotransferase subunit C|nr:Asp-tRNA(Asn)/Glu-tRNA(Gln) amidotransferase subunit GatC [Gracilibacteraceae bacterium]